MTMIVQSLTKEFQHCEALVRANPKNPRAYIERGMAHFKLAQIPESLRDFDYATQLDANLIPYLWQRGLSLYYADRFTEAANQFELDLTVNGRDIEETIWLYLCIARLEGGDVARNRLVRTVYPVRQDPRSFMQSIYDFYAGACDLDEVLAEGRQSDRAMFYSHLYLGLYYEVMADVAQAQFYLMLAAEQFPLPDYMWHLACVHKQLRGWTTSSGN
ncbi:tetratricopeptide repeat protein [Pantanalinema rosaneae CENA516]|uniref:tetratricopeptide repeat protein n=1 Tax=Pantanalinema rosaneae TaxID=1620701 RepID=UPI003D6EC575